MNLKLLYSLFFIVRSTPPCYSEFHVGSNLKYDDTSCKTFISSDLGLFIVIFLMTRKQDDCNFRIRHGSGRPLARGVRIGSRSKEEEEAGGEEESSDRSSVSSQYSETRIKQVISLDYYSSAHFHT